MTIYQQMFRYGQRRATTRLGRALPWIGTTIALLALTSRIRRKGFVRGTADTALTALPVIGGLKSFLEIVMGHDLFHDRPVRG